MAQAWKAHGATQVPACSVLSPAVVPPEANLSKGAVSDERAKVLTLEWARTLSLVNWVRQTGQSSSLAAQFSTMSMLSPDEQDSLSSGEAIVVKGTGCDVPARVDVTVTQDGHLALLGTYQFPSGCEEDATLPSGQQVQLAHYDPGQQVVRLWVGEERTLTWVGSLFYVDRVRDCTNPQGVNHDPLFDGYCSYAMGLAQ